MVSVHEPCRRFQQSFACERSANLARARLCGRFDQRRTYKPVPGSWGSMKENLAGTKWNAIGTRPRMQDRTHIGQSVRRSMHFRRMRTFRVRNRLQGVRARLSGTPNSALTDENRLRGCHWVQAISTPFARERLMTVLARIRSPMSTPGHESRGYLSGALQDAVET